MTVKECYEAMGGDYEDVLKRLMSEARVQKFALMFKKDPSMSQLTQAMDAGDVETAFRAAHTLKGICANLGFKSLFEVSYEMTEALRAGDMEKAKGTLKDVQDALGMLGKELGVDVRVQLADIFYAMHRI